MENNENIRPVWDILSAINVNEFTETKDSGSGVTLTYLSWASAWGLLKERFPDATFSFREWDGKPYLFDPSLGYIVQTYVTVRGETLSMMLPVLDNNNKAQKDVPYTYTTKRGEKSVNAATMFDINTALMRCLVKNIALFGLGHYIYAGEDLPQVEAEQKKKEEAEAFVVALNEIKETKSMDDIKALRDKYPKLANNNDFRQAIIDKAKTLSSYGN